jgi:capsular polysaccharide biosynthesis protein
MRLEDYIKVIRKRWWIIGLVALVAAVSAYGFSKLQPTLFRSTARYVVLVNRADSGANLFFTNLVNPWILQVNNPDMMQDISNQLQLDLPGTALMELVRFQAQPDQNLIVIEADYGDPGTAQQLATVAGQRLNGVVVEANRLFTSEDRVTLSPAGSASAPYLSQPRTRINVLAGAILGLVLGTLLAFVLEYLDDTLKTAGDVERFTDLVTIGAIPGGAAQGGRARPRWRAAPSAGIVASSQQRTPHDK